VRPCQERDKGESPIGIASSPTQPGYLEFTVQKAGVVTSTLHEMEVGAVTVICGPPVMIRLTLPVFFELGFSKENIITSLEMQMKCGIGKCGRCNVREKYVCKDGPVFSLAELDKLTKEY
jgi:NAD(P)H-flavin reductase